MELDTIRQIIQDHGLLVLAPVSILEGPIVTVIASWLAREGLLNIFAVYVICVIGDLVGDVAMYWLGRRGVSPRWRKRFGLTPSRMTALRKHFREQGPRTVMIGKLTHSAGFAVLLAAGATRMRFWPFFWWNTLATLPKTLFFVLLGYFMGGAYASINHWIGRVTLVLLVLMIALAAGWWIKRRIAAAAGEVAKE
ncbi:MAG: DedA family protein [Paracoccus sp. (in: a-proteobacteria)]|uniref:DedA family protein n=1 Tax=Paracoccus sp. TaxID=267 RepID=UPI0026DEC7AA|nr:DedA family protein [Paracoccus sp. (in: a-proteobacteria)]MDO5620113.1 DedA family protein [Paracoccus sp. (in: a-proteobacteria)]